MVAFHGRVDDAASVFSMNGAMNNPVGISFCDRLKDLGNKNVRCHYIISLKIYSSKINLCTGPFSGVGSAIKKEVLLTSRLHNLGY